MNVTVGAVIGIFPLLVRMTVWELLVKLRGWSANARTAGETVAPRSTVTPLPDRLIVCGLPVAVSVRVVAPERAPAAVGENTTAMVQEKVGLKFEQPLVVMR